MLLWSFDGQLHRYFPRLVRVDPDLPKILAKIRDNQLPKLSEVLRYENDVVLRSFSVKFQIPIRESKTIFKDMIRYLWMGSFLKANNSSRSIPMTDYWAVIDEMWHEFILHSEDYHNFCLRFFRKQIWHIPGSVEVRQKSLSKSASVRDREYRWVMGTIYDLFGPTVLKRWFGTYPKKYTQESLCERQLKAWSQRRLQPRLK